MGNLAHMYVENFADAEPTLVSAQYNGESLLLLHARSPRSESQLQSMLGGEMSEEIKANDSPHTSLMLLIEAIFGMCDTIPYIIL
jgi:hypothetical protein